MRFSICFVLAFILLLSAAGCNCCYQPGYYAPNGLAYAPSLQPPAFKPLPKPTWLGSRTKKHDPTTCPLCSSGASSSPYSVPGPYQTPLAVPHNGEFIHEGGTIGHSHGGEGFHQHYEDQPVQLNGIVPTSHTEDQYPSSGVRHAGHESHGHGTQGGCGCGSPGCHSGCSGNCGHSKGQCGADRNRKGGCGCGAQHAHKPNCSGAKNCGCGAPSNCGCSGVVSNCGPCVTCDVVEGFPMSGTVMDGGCSTCGTSFGGSGIAMGSVVPGTIMDGQIISGGMIPGEVIGGGVIFDGAIVDDGSYLGTTYATDKPCPNCGKNHSANLTPMPEAQSHEKATPGKVKPGTLKPHTPSTQPYDEKATDGAGTTTEEQAVPAANVPSATNIPEALPSSFGSPRAIEESLPAIHPPAGASRARTTPSSWRTSGSRPAQLQDAAEEFHEPVQEPTPSIQPTTLMIPTIPDLDDTRHVHWVPENAK